jgi:hypothetical protein
MKPIEGGIFHQIRKIIAPSFDINPNRRAVVYDEKITTIIM